jgi:hypothetical protein
MRSTLRIQVHGIKEYRVSPSLSRGASRRVVVNCWETRIACSPPFRKQKQLVLSERTSLLPVVPPRLRLAFWQSASHAVTIEPLLG